jgi:hypothetical protein
MQEFVKPVHNSTHTPGISLGAARFMHWVYLQRTSIQTINNVLKKVFTRHFFYRNLYYRLIKKMK